MMLSVASIFPVGLLGEHKNITWVCGVTASSTCKTREVTGLLTNTSKSRRKTEETEGWGGESKKNIASHSISFHEVFTTFYDKMHIKVFLTV